MAPHPVPVRRIIFVECECAEGGDHPKTKRAANFSAPEGGGGGCFLKRKREYIVNLIVFQSAGDIFIKLLIIVSKYPIIFAYE